jgi:hypothetical protein
MTTETAVSRSPEAKVTMELSLPDGGGEIRIGDDEIDLKPERIQIWLESFPAWRLGADDRTLHRAKSFPTAAVAAQYGVFVTGLAAALSLPVRVSIAGGEVELALYSGCRCGKTAPLTGAVLGLAEQIG